MNQLTKIILSLLVSSMGVTPLAAIGSGMHVSAEQMQEIGKLMVAGYKDEEPATIQAAKVVAATLSNDLIGDVVHGSLGRTSTKTSPRLVSTRGDSSVTSPSTLTAAITLCALGVAAFLVNGAYQTRKKNRALPFQKAAAKSHSWWS